MNNQEYFKLEASMQRRLEAAKKERRSELIKEITSSKEKALEFLKEAGICDSNGELSEIYK